LIHHEIENNNGKNNLDKIRNLSKELYLYKLNKDNIKIIPNKSSDVTLKIFDYSKKLTETNIKIFSGVYFDKLVHINETVLQNFEQRNLYFKSLSLLAKINHPNILKFFGYYKEDDNYNLKEIKIYSIIEKVNEKFIDIYKFLSIRQTHMDYNDDNNNYNKLGINSILKDKKISEIKYHIILKVLDILIYFEDLLCEKNLVEILKEKTNDQGENNLLYLNFNLFNIFFALNPLRNLKLKFLLFDEMHNFSILKIEEKKFISIKEKELELIKKLIFINDIFILYLEKMDKMNLKTIENEKNNNEFNKFIFEIYSNANLFFVFSFYVFILELIFEIDKNKILRIMEKYLLINLRLIKKQDESSAEFFIKDACKKIYDIIEDERKFKRNKNKINEEEIFNQKIIQFLVLNFNYFQNKDSNRSSIREIKDKFKNLNTF